MPYLGKEASGAVFSGTALQVVLADDEGLVLEALGTAYPPELLAASFLGSGGAIDRVRRLLHVGVVSEMTLRLEQENVVLAARFFHYEDDRFILLVVVPPASSAKILGTRIISEFLENLEARRKK